MFAYVGSYTTEKRNGRGAGITVYAIDARSGSWSLVQTVAGPYAYVNNELDSTVTTYRFDSERGGLEPLQTISTVPADFTAKNTTAEIAVAPSGRFVYVSNRGHDSIAIFAVDAASGRLSAVGWEPAQGKTPRFFALDPPGASLYVANQNSDTIVAFRVEAVTGLLTASDQVIHTGSPSSIVFR